MSRAALISYGARTTVFPTRTTQRSTSAFCVRPESRPFPGSVFFPGANGEPEAAAVYILQIERDDRRSGPAAGFVSLTAITGRRSSKGEEAALGCAAWSQRPGLPEAYCGYPVVIFTSTICWSWRRLCSGM